MNATISPASSPLSAVAKVYRATSSTVMHVQTAVFNIRGIDGAWYNVDVTHDINNINSYGFYPITDYDSADENFVIVRMY